MMLHKFPDRVITEDGKDYLYFGGTSYLGLATHPGFQEEVIKGLQKWGTAYGSSRNANVELSIYKRAEQQFASQLNYESALTFTSGTLAGKLVTEHLQSQTQVFYHFPKTHPAIIHPNSKLIFKNHKLHPNLCDAKPEKIVIAADAISALSVLPTSFKSIENIHPVKKITLVIDQSHSLGVLELASSQFEYLQESKIECIIIVASLNKAMGMVGGIVASKNVFIDSMRSSDAFISASGMNPAFLEAYVNSEQILKAQQFKLRENLEYFWSDLKLTNCFTADALYPVIYCNDETIFEYLKSNGVIITSFRYPNYENTMNRIVITANHKRNDLQKLQMLLNNFK